MTDIEREFTELYKANITCQGSDELLRWLDENQFFSAPASTAYHNAYQGGLAQHSINVYKRLILEPESKEYDNQTLAICGLLHDIVKCGGTYTKDYRNVKNDRGQWERVPCYKFNDVWHIEHGEASVILIQRFLDIPMEVCQAIANHMGAFASSYKGGSSTVSNTFANNKLALLLHIADLKATYLDEA